MIIIITIIIIIVVIITQHYSSMTRINKHQKRIPSTYTHVRIHTFINFV